jgi:hypothetical protein
MLARWLLLFLRSAVNPDAGAPPMWHRLLPITSIRRVTYRHGGSFFSPRRAIIAPKMRLSLMGRLLLVGCVVSALALNLPQAMSPMTGEVVSLLHRLSLGSGAFPICTRAEECLARTAARLAAPAEARCTRADYDWDDDASDILPRLASAHVFPSDTVSGGCNALTHADAWPTHYLVRPQRLSRL